MLKEFLKLLAAKTGHKISKQMPFFLKNNESLVQISFEHVLSELITSVDNCQFIQVGANDGKLNDPLRKYIHRKYLKGVMIEPQPEIFKKLKDNYAEIEIDGISFENIAIDHDSGFKDLYTVKNPSNPEDLWAHAAASFDRSHIEKMLSQDSLNAGGECIEKVAVRCENFEYILDKYEISKLDLLQIDVEGYDFELLKIFPFARVTPRIIHFEHLHLNETDRNASLKFLHNLGYSFVVEYFDITAVHKI
jgi:FkbM family methyltransferase